MTPLYTNEDILKLVAEFEFEGQAYSVVKAGNAEGMLMGMRNAYEAYIAKLEARIDNLEDNIPLVQETAYHHGYIAGQGLKG